MTSFLISESNGIKDIIIQSFPISSINAVLHSSEKLLDHSLRFPLDNVILNLDSDLHSERPSQVGTHNASKKLLVRFMILPHDSVIPKYSACSHVTTKHLSKNDSARANLATLSFR